MTTEQPDPNFDPSEVKLRPLRFLPVESLGSKAVYRTSIENPDAVCTLTVTVAPELYETEVLRDFLDDMKASFVLTKPNPEGGSGYDREEPVPLDLDKEILIEVDVAAHAPDTIFDADVIVRTAVAGDEDLSAVELRSAREPEPPAAAAIREKVLPGKDHRWSANNGVIRTATATARQNSGSIRNQQGPNPNQALTVGGGSRSERGRTVWVHGGTSSMVYDMSANFHRS